MSTKLHGLLGYKALIYVAIIALTFYIALPQFGGLYSSRDIFSHLEWRWLSVALLFTLLTYLFAALTYFLLALKPLYYLQLLLVQFAAMFINKLLPAGIGALGANYTYLKKRGYNQVQAGSTVAVNNLLGIAGHFIVIICTGLLLARHAKLAQLIHKPPHFGLIIGVGVVVLVGGVLVARANKRFRSSLKHLKIQLKNFAGHPLHLGGALASSISLTLCNVLALACCALTLGIHLSFIESLLVFSAGAAAASAVPTPGGLGGFESGLFAGLVAYHVPAPPALALALLYRVISYWLPLVLGGVAFMFAQAQNLFAL